MNIQEQNKLLYARAGFGIALDDFKNPKPISACVEGLFPKTKPGRLELITENEWSQNSPRVMKMMTDEVEKKQKRKEFDRKVGEMNLLWMEAMVRTSFPLLEKMSLFWHGHFATRIRNPYYDQLLLNDIRANALGNFGDLLRAASKSSSMLLFLNNQQNKKMHPNENFAREVMELFTLGRGHYTEDDIKEAARAFTGWGIDEDGGFKFRQGQHDTGTKTFLGQTGNFNGDDILNILLDQKQTAVFITQKIYRYFVSDTKIDSHRVKELANNFYESDYNIAALLKDIFMADWFYSREVQAAKIKSPVELLVGYQRLMPMAFANPKVWINLQRILGQFLFNPPNVAGWSGGKNWIDSSTLVIRMRLPEAILASKELDLNMKVIEPDMRDGRKVSTADLHTNEKFRVGKLDMIDWSDYISFWKNTPQGDIVDDMARYFLPNRLTDVKLKEIGKFADKSSPEKYIKSLTILFMELPEYQLC